MFTDGLYCCDSRNHGEMTETSNELYIERIKDTRLDGF